MEAVEAMVAPEALDRLIFDPATVNDPPSEVKPDPVRVSVIVSVELPKAMSLAVVAPMLIWPFDPAVPPLAAPAAPASIETFPPLPAVPVAPEEAPPAPAARVAAPPVPDVVAPELTLPVAPAILTAPPATLPVLEVAPPVKARVLPAPVAKLAGWIVKLAAEMVVRSAL